MKEYFPDYYKDFKCSPKECKHNCCIGWEIDIDDETVKEYMSVKGELGNKIRSSVFEDEGGFHFKLDSEERCPFLNSCNLCDIILNLGEDKLCQICTDHPRYRNYYDNYIETGLGLCCEVACKLILDKQTPSCFLLSEDDLKDGFVVKKKTLLDMVNSPHKTTLEKIKELFEYAECDFEKLEYTYWSNFYQTLENLDIKWKDVLNNSNRFIEKVSDDSWEKQFSQLLAYFIMRHFTDEEQTETIAFSALSVYMIYNIFFASGNITKENLIEISRMYSSEIEYSENNIDDILWEIDITLKG